MLKTSTMIYAPPRCFWRACQVLVSPIVYKRPSTSPTSHAYLSIFTAMCNLQIPIHY